MFIECIMCLILYGMVLWDVRNAGLRTSLLGLNERHGVSGG